MSAPDYMARSGTAPFAPTWAPDTPYQDVSPPDTYNNPVLADDDRYRRMSEDAQRAHDFAMWAFGPPSEVRPGPMGTSSRAVSMAQDLGPTPRASRSFHERWPAFEFGTSPAPPMVRNPFFPSPQDDPQYPFSNPPISYNAPGQGPPAAQPQPPNDKGSGAQPEGQMSPQQRSQICALDAATIAAELGNKLQSMVGKVDPLTKQVVTQDWVNRQAAEMQKNVERIQTELGCPPETY
jgi:hypothetical protein